MTALILFVLALVLSGRVGATLADDPPVYDILVYGDSSGAVAAAVAAKRHGRSVILVNPTGFLGGMSASGFGATDFLGKRSTFGGIASEFFDAIASVYVMTQHDCMSERKSPDPVGLGSFGMDSHVVQYYVNEKGHVRRDGTIWRVPPRPYGISYRSIVPRRGECENLLVPICLSASHVAHGSIRMEPVFMVLGQSATIAAGIAMEQAIKVQDVPYSILRERLDADKQIVQLDAPKTFGAQNRKKR